MQVPAYLDYKLVIYNNPPQGWNFNHNSNTGLTIWEINTIEIPDYIEPDTNNPILLGKICKDRGSDIIPYQINYTNRDGQCPKTWTGSFDCNDCCGDIIISDWGVPGGEYCCRTIRFADTNSNSCSICGFKVEQMQCDSSIDLRIIVPNTQCGLNLDNYAIGLICPNSCQAGTYTTTLKLTIYLGTGPNAKTCERTFVNITPCSTNKESFERYEYIKTSEINHINNFNTFPNPANDEINISFELMNKSKIILEIADISGNLISEICNREYEIGNIDFRYNIANFISGTYFVRLNVNGLIYYYQFKILK